MQNVNEIMSEELVAGGLDVDRLDEMRHYAVQSITPVLDNVITALGEKPEALRVAAAALRSYARVAEQYAARLSTRTPQADDSGRWWCPAPSGEPKRRDTSQAASGPSGESSLGRATTRAL